MVEFVVCLVESMRGDICACLFICWLLYLMVLDTVLDCSFVGYWLVIYCVVTPVVVSACDFWFWICCEFTSWSASLCCGCDSDWLSVFSGFPLSLACQSVLFVLRPQQSFVGVSSDF